LVQIFQLPQCECELSLITLIDSNFRIDEAIQLSSIVGKFDSLNLHLKSVTFILIKIISCKKQLIIWDLNFLHGSRLANI
jgi:hypothetical protein